MLEESEEYFYLPTAFIDQRYYIGRQIQPVSTNQHGLRWLSVMIPQRVTTILGLFGGF
jgi:hypothetical protein